MEMEMELEEINIDEIFDLKPILPEIYSISNTKHCYSNCWDSNCYSTGQEQITNIMIPNPSSNSTAAPKLLSFENSTALSDIVSRKSDQAAAPNSNSQILKFSSSAEDNYQDTTNRIFISQKRGCTTTGRTMSQARDHLMAEKRRRENLGQLFISLSKVVPGLKKLDKASLLEYAIDYLKALQERVSILEEEMSKKNFIDASKDDNYESSIENNNSRSTIRESSDAAEIKARISDRHVLIKIHCKKQKGLMSRVPCQMEKMHLSVLDMRIMPFGDQALDITLLAEMQSEFRGTVKDIIDHLQTVFFNPRDNMQEQDSQC